LLTRNIRQTIALLPPLCTTEQQLQRTVAALTEAIREAAEGRASARPGLAAASPSEVARS
jgi:acetylornithine/succinyldiaminopimelate/putrescine aminotransferase